MTARAFDPSLLDLIDGGLLEESDFQHERTEDGEPPVMVVQCPICGEHDLVLEVDMARLIDLDGNPHECPEA